VIGDSEMTKFMTNKTIAMPCTWIAAIKNTIPSEYDHPEFDLWRMDVRNQALDSTVNALTKVDGYLQKLEGAVENLRTWVKGKSTRKYQ
jgi:hypothetical protein